MADNGLFTLDNVQMPFSLEAEQAVLGSVLKDPSCLSQATVYIKPDSFFLPQHKEIFETMITLDNMGQTFDALIVLNALVQKGVYEKGAGKNYLFELAQMVPSTENIEMYAKIVREKSYMRTLIEISGKTIEDAVEQRDTADALLDNAEQQIYNIRQGKTSNAPSKLKDIIVNDVFETLRKITGEDKDQYKGFTTGYSDLDKILTGLNRSDLVLIGARPAMGKTSFALNLARNVAAIGKRKVLFFSLEMTKAQLAMRVLGTEARVSSMKMRNGNISVDEWKRLGMAAGALNDCELYFDDTSSITVPEMKAKTRRLGGVDCVIIDYLGLIKGSTRTENRVQEVSEMTRNLKMMAKDLNIPIVCCAQLSRGTEGRGKSHRPQLADLRESGSIEQDADIVMMLYRPDYYKAENDDNDDGSEQQPDVNIAEVLVVKNRHGETGTVEFAWDGEHTLFLQLEKVHDD